MISSRVTIGNAVMISAIITFGSIVLARSVPLTVSPTNSHGYGVPPEMGVYKKAAVATHAKQCSEMGVEILRKNGSAVDAAITALICQGIDSPQSMGLGGGLGMTIYDAATGQAEFLDSREVAPAKATRDMFGENPNASRSGGLAIAVPGMLAGLWEAHKKYGKLAWMELLLPVIELCEAGSIVNPYLERAMTAEASKIFAEPSLANFLVNPERNSTWTTGEKIKWPKLAETLKKLGREGVDIFYNGTMGEKIVEEIKSFGGIIEMDDLRNYRVKWMKPVNTTLKNNMTLYTSNLPGSGVLLSFIINILDQFLPSPNENIFWQRFVETLKWAYGRRTLLGDIGTPESDDLIANLTSKVYANDVRENIKDTWTSSDSAYYGAIFETPDDAGTCHIAVLAPDGSAVSVTSTINQRWGAYRRSMSTGIIFNNQMDDFSLPRVTNGYGVRPSPANYIKPGKRPLSSTVPTIIVDKNGEVQMIVGGSGGPKITSAVASTIILNMWGGYDIKRAVEARRLHHQLFPMEILAEKHFPESILKYLAEVGHTIRISPSPAPATINAISKFNTQSISAYSDYRRYGEAAGF